ncbi:hypothetical protein HYN59_11885 [Flavobacterium album]|uniref:Uncharacterized protein n=1 Tax=Flavobacterium album TaxID=2175091 RepID=A0A2S1QZB3_9FLAO|nr:hypothetical protein [Flavobacterium album]AWH85766.1 hypothetical protein HYN59_11885 [Flavobacterium album]
MKTIFIYIIVVIVIAIIILIFIARGKSRRQLQKSKNNIQALKDGKANYEFEIQRPLDTASLSKIKDVLAGHNFRIIDNVADGIIAYSGKNEDATLHGWQNIDSLKLPLRIVVINTASNNIKVKFADDYGFQILNAAQKEKFNAVYSPAFKHYEALLKNI